MDADTASGLADHGDFISSDITIDSRWRNGASAIDSANPPISLRANLNWMARSSDSMLAEQTGDGR